MAVRQKQELVGDVVADHADGIWQFGQDPHSFTLTQRSRRMVNRGLFSDHRVKEGERLPVLHRGVAAAHHAEHIERVLAGHSVLVGYGQAQKAAIAFAGVQGQLLDLPVQAGGPDGFLGGSGFVEGGSEVVPRNPSHVHH